MLDMSVIQSDGIWLLSGVLLLRRCFSAEFARDSDNRKVESAEQNEKSKVLYFHLQLDCSWWIPYPKLPSGHVYTATYHFDTGQKAIHSSVNGTELRQLYVVGLAFYLSAKRIKSGTASCISFATNC